MLQVLNCWMSKRNLLLLECMFFPMYFYSVTALKKLYLKARCLTNEIHINHNQENEKRKKGAAPYQWPDGYCVTSICQLPYTEYQPLFLSIFVLSYDWSISQPFKSEEITFLTVIAACLSLGSILSRYYVIYSFCRECMINRLAGMFSFFFSFALRMVLLEWIAVLSFYFSFMLLKYVGNFNWFFLVDYFSLLITYISRIHHGFFNIKRFRCTWIWIHIRFISVTLCSVQVMLCFLSGIAS